MSSDVCTFGFLCVYVHGEWGVEGGAESLTAAMMMFYLHLLSWGFSFDQQGSSSFLKPAFALWSGQGWRYDSTDLLNPTRPCPSCLVTTTCHQHIWEWQRQHLDKTEQPAAIFFHSSVCSVFDFTRISFSFTSKHHCITTYSITLALSSRRHQLRARNHQDERASRWSRPRL